MYNYREAMKEDVLQAIREGYTLTDYTDRNDLEERLNDDLWIDDAVTGNASGSYYCNAWKAREAVTDDGAEYLREAVSEFGISAEEIGKHFINEDWEWIDVTIRCYLLGQAIAEALDELEEDRAFASEETNEEEPTD